MSADRFDELVRDVLLERAPDTAPPELRARVAAVPHEVPLPRRPSRFPALAAGLAAMAVIGTLLVLAALHAVTVGPARPSPSPTAQSVPLAHFQGDGFGFDYPPSWRVSLDYRGSSATLVAVGTAGTSVACVRPTPGPSGVTGLGCAGMNDWTVPADGVVVLYHTQGSPGFPVAVTGLGPSPIPGATRVLVAGRLADRRETATSIEWRFDGQGLSAIEARFGVEAAPAARAQVEALVTSWRWGSALLAPPPSTAPTLSAASAWPFRAADALAPVVGPDGTVYVSTAPWAGGQGKIYALDPAGHVKPGWPFAPAGIVALGRPVVASDGTVYVAGFAATEAPQAPGSNAAFLWALDSSGRTRSGWPFAIQGTLAPAAPGAWLLVTPDGGVMFATSRAPTGGPATSEALALDHDGKAVPGWPVTLPGGISCYGGACTTMAADGTWYGMVLPAQGQDAEIVALHADGSAMAGWPVSIAGGEGFALGLDGSVYAWGVDTARADTRALPVIQRTRFVRLGSDGRPAQGWPVTITGCAGVPAIAPDGTLYSTAGCERIVGGVSQPPAEPERILALAPDGTERPGWPAPVPSGVLAWPYAPVEGLPSRAYSPSVGPDGTVYLPVHRPADYVRQGLLAFSSDGSPRSGWPVWLSGGLSLATPGGTGGGAGLIPFAFGRNATVYVSTSGGATASLLALRADGSVPPCWPVVVTDASPARTARFTSLAVLPDGSLLASGGMGSGSIVTVVPASGVCVP